MGTALKILYSEKLNQATERGLWDKPHIEAEPLFRLTRTEIVTLFNAFGRYVLQFSQIKFVLKIIKGKEDDTKISLHI